MFWVFMIFLMAAAMWLVAGAFTLLIAIINALTAPIRALFGKNDK